MKRVNWMRSTALATALAAALIGLHGNALAQAEEQKDANQSGGISSLFSGIGQSVGGLFDGSSDKPLLETLKQGPYTPSNQAIGVERDIESYRLENFGLVPIKTFQDYANGIYARLKDVSGVSGLPGNVYLLATSELASTSTPDGNLFVSVAWIKTIESEDELAALIAHELSHVLMHHHDSTLFSSVQKQLQFAFGVGADLKNKLDDLQGASAALTPGQRKSLARMQLLIDLTDKVMLPAWTRSQEMDADRLGTDLLRKAGYSATGMWNFLGHVEAWDKQQEERRKEKEAQVQAEMQTLVNSGSIDGALKLGLKNSGEALKESLASQHENGEKRKEEFTAYRDKHHADWPRVVIGKEAYGKVITDKAVKSVLDAYAATFAAITDLEQGRYEDAYKLLLPVTKANAAGATQAMPNFELYRAMEFLGRKESNAQLVKSYHAAEPSWKPYAAAIRSEAKQGHRPQALQIVKEARERFKDAPALTPLLVEIYAELGFKEELQQELVTCNAIHVTYRERCQQVAKR
ncbi:MAG TPA: M48 family metalloprotease [Noviherbaspirillum sp.]|uniref:M48 family metallopeptidase n=1 Tax=Noviherbaspirillum sp. TaxID=1926288 RepID=UPI002B468C6A|nr:M48 family metalloprotease [Noviherbaspirillum sp.]HJV86300.1 M48 family metalloprotease [Noviherbaspirillum sp.]